MTAQNTPTEDRPETETGIEADPIGPMMVPARSRLGARALALVGTVGFAALGLAAVADTCSTWPTIEV